MTAYTISSGVTSTGLPLNSGDVETVLSGGIASGTVVSAGGLEIVSRGGVSEGATVSPGGVQQVFGTARDAAIIGGSNGGPAAEQDVGAGGVASDTQLSQGAVENVVSGGTAIGSVAGLLSFIKVSAGGVASGSILSGSYAQETVASGGLAQGVLTRFGGSVAVSSGGSATSAVIGNGGSGSVQAGGVVTDLNVLSGGAFADIGTVILVDGDMVSAIAVTGILDVAPGSVVAGPLQNGGTIDLLAGTDAPFLVVSGSGLLKVEPGSTLGAAISDTGMIVLEPGAFLSGTGFAGGGALSVLSGGVLSGSMLNDFTAEVYAGGTADGVTVNSGTLLVESGGKATNTIVNSGAIAAIDPGGVASNTIINAGGSANVTGTATAAQVDGGILYFYSGLGSGTVINSGGDAYVFSGSVVTGENVGSGGSEIVLSGGEADGTYVNSGGFQYVSNGGVANSAAYAGGDGFVYSGGLTVGAVIASGGVQAVASSGQASGTILSANGTQTVSSGGQATETVVNSGGMQGILLGGTAVNAIVNSGGVENDAGETSGTVLSASVEDVQSGGGSFATDVVSGATETVSAGGTATSTTIGEGGTLHLLSGGMATGDVQFAGPGAVLVIDGTAMPTAPINGFTYNQAIDITALDYVSSATLSIGTGDLVTIAVPFGGSESLTITGASTDVISLGPLAGGGTQITLVGPAPTGLALSPGSDSGTLGDGITTVTTPLITGTGVPGDTITLFDGAAQAGTALVGDDGTWSASTTALSIGDHTLTASQTDSFGNVSAGSIPLAITIVAPPLAPTVALDPGSDTGALGDGFTSVATPLITGTGVAGDTVTLDEGTTVLGTTTVAGDGTWSVQTSTLADGPHALTATETDADGDQSDPSKTLALVIDTSTPPPPAALALATGGSLTNVATPVITGTASPGSTVTLYDGHAAAGSAVADQAGNWSITASALAGGQHSLTAIQTNVAGTSSSASTPLAVTIGATTAYSALFLYGQGTAPVALGIAAPTSTVYSAGQLAIAVQSLPTDGTVSLANGTPVTVGQALTAAQLTTLLFTPSGAGNDSSFSYGVTDPGSFVATGSISLTEGSRSLQVSLSGQVPNDPTPTIGGTAAPGVTVTLRSNGTAIGTAAADPVTGAYAITPATPLALGLNRLTVTAVLSGGVTTASAPLFVFVVQAPVNSVSTTDFSSANIGAALNAGATLQFVAGTEAVSLTDGTLSVGSDTTEATIQRLYEGLLGRTGDASGISFFDAQLISGTDPSAVAIQLLASPEYAAAHGSQTDAQFIATLFSSLLGRSAAADPGSGYWASLLAGGASRADVAVGLADSAEAKAYLASDTAEIFVSHAPGLLAHELYETGLGREVDLPALGNVDSAFGTMTASQLAKQVASSAEFAADHAGQTNAAYVNSLYLAGLGRVADSAASFWTGLLDGGTASRGDVLLGIATTAEAAGHLTSSLTQTH